MRRTEHVTLHALIRQQVVQAIPLPRRFVNEDDPVRVVSPSKVEQMLQHGVSPFTVVAKRPLLRLAHPRSNLQQHVPIVQITANDGNLIHGSASRLE